MTSITRTIRRTAALVAVSLIAAATATGLGVQTASAARSCSSQPYAYAGLIGARSASGLKATITAVSAPRVASGHVAGWIGVGGPGRGANGQDAWIQIGINSLPSSGNNLYAESWIPGYGHAYKPLGQVAAGEQVKVSVLELPGKPGWWQASVNGKPVTQAVYRPGSHGAWEPMAMTETWNGGSPSCNDFTYRFTNVRISTGQSWQGLRDAQTLTDAGYRISGRTLTGFVAGSES